MKGLKIEDWAARIRGGDVRALARAATAIENKTPQAANLLDELPSRGALIVGVTGPPGAGKSTLVDRLCRLIRDEDKRVAVLAVDPTSPVSGGAFLGDRIRMASHHGDAGVYIRSMATRGALGGLAETTANLARLLDGAGFDVVLIETVGVGQAEVEISRAADVVVVVLAPGMGDDVQAIKAGILEIADLFAVNKADRPGADALVQELRSERPGTPACQTVATEGSGVGELWTAVQGSPRRKRRDRHDQEPFSIDHLGVAVPDLDDALLFWNGKLGMRYLARETVEIERVHVAMLDAGGPRVELLEAADAGSVVAKFLAKRGPGLHHIALRVSDFRGVVEKLRASGVRLLSEPRKGAGGHTYVFVHPASTGGVLVELIAEEKDS